METNRRLHAEVGHAMNIYLLCESISSTLVLFPQVVWSVGVSCPIYHPH